MQVLAYSRTCSFAQGEPRKNLSHLLQYCAQQMPQERLLSMAMVSAYFASAPSESQRQSTSLQMLNWTLSRYAIIYMHSQWLLRMSALLITPHRSKHKQGHGLNLNVPQKTSLSLHSIQASASRCLNHIYILWELQNKGHKAGTPPFFVDYHS